MFNFEADISGDIARISVEGDLDSNAAPKLNQKISEISSNAKEIHFDFAKLDFLTSAGLRTILYARQIMDDKDGRMTIKSVNNDIMEIFKMTGFLDVLEIVD